MWNNRDLMKSYMDERVRNPKWWVGLTGVALLGVAAFLRLAHGGSSTTLLLSLAGLGLYFIWVARDRGFETRKYEPLTKNKQ